MFFWLPIQDFKIFGRQDPRSFVHALSLSLSLSIYLSFCASIDLFVFSIYLSDSVSINLFVSIQPLCLSLYLSLSISLYISILSLPLYFSLTPCSVFQGHFVQIRKTIFTLFLDQIRRTVIFTTSISKLGFPEQITLQLEPMFKRSITNRPLSDLGFEHNIPNFALSAEFGDIIWYPGQARVVYRDDVRLPITFPGKGKNDFTGFQPQVSGIVAGIRATGPIFSSH